MILFLDFDGVLHPWDPKIRQDETKMFYLVPQLERVLQNFPEVEVVISSSWREKYHLDKLRHLFSPEMRHRIIGVTPHTRFDELGRYPRGCRGQEIQQWLFEKQRDPNRWLALDDLDWLFDEKSLKNVVLCASAHGLTEEKAAELSDRLQKMQAQ